VGVDLSDILADEQNGGRGFRIESAVLMKSHIAECVCDVHKVADYMIRDVGCNSILVSAKGRCEFMMSVLCRLVTAA